LSADGLRLVTLSSDGTQYAQMSRPARGEYFSEGGEGPFSRLNDAASAGDVTYGGGILGADDLSFVHLGFPTDDNQFPMRISTRSGDAPWPAGVPIEQCEFQIDDSGWLGPSALTADGLTLFFYDPRRTTCRAAWRASAGTPFTWFVDLPARGAVIPNADCTKLYYSGSETGGLRVAPVR
jgi:hypothetical protein